MFKSYEKYIKTRFCFISLPYHMKMLFKRGTAVQFFFSKVLPDYLAEIDKFLGYKWLF